MRKRFFTVMAAALVVSGIPVMAKETSTEEEISEAVEETKDSTEAESVVSGNEDRISEIEKQIHDLEKQIAALKEERKQLRESNVTEIGDVIYQDESVIITYNGIKEDEYGDGYSINFITENLTDKKIIFERSEERFSRNAIVQYEDASLNDLMFYAVYSANLAPNKKSKDEIDMYESYDEYCPMEDLEYLEFKVAVLDGDSYDEICISDPVTISFE